MNFIRKIATLFTQNQSTDIKKNSLNNIRSNSKKVEVSAVVEEQLNPGEILLLDYVNGMEVNNANLPGYFTYSYNLDIQKSLSKLINQNLLTTNTPLEKKLEKSLVKKLKAILKEHGLKVSGSKRELIDRLIENLTLNQLNYHFQNELYSVTAKGLKILDENSHIKFFHQHAKWEISIFKANSIKRENPYLSNYDIAWEQFNLKSNEYSSKGDWGLYRNTRLNMATLMMEENKYIEALNLLFEVCYYDLSGLSNGFNIKYIDIYDKHFFPYENSIYTLAPGVIGYLIKTKEILSLDYDSFESHYINYIESVTTQIHLFTKEEVIQIIIAEMKEDKAVVAKIYSESQIRYMTNKKSIVNYRKI